VFGRGFAMRGENPHHDDVGARHEPPVRDKGIQKMATLVQSRPRSDASLRAEELLGRYPNLGEREVAELINLFPHVPILDLGLMRTDDRLSGKIARFESDHGSKLGTPIHTLLYFLAVPVTLGAGAIWALAG
jgi:hypothetical protein